MMNADTAALDAAIWPGTTLCTVVGIDGSFSRRIGAQIAVTDQGETVGSLSDGCLERQLASDSAIARQNGAPRLIRYGKGSSIVDFRLPCGGGLDIWVDPEPDRSALREVSDALHAREAVHLPLALPSDAPLHALRSRFYIPPLRILAFGEGPEMKALNTLAQAAGVAITIYSRESGLSLGKAPHELSVDPWTSVLLLFHDHEWERALLPWAMASRAFYIGAQGGGIARQARRDYLREQGFSQEAVARVQSPAGLIPRARDANVLALSVLAETISRYEALHPHR